MPIPPASRRTPDGPVVDLSPFPLEYAMRVVGHCMAPALADRSKAVFSKIAVWKVNDVVAIWLRPEIIEPGQLQASVKRLVMAPPPYVKSFPHREHPDSNIAAFVMIESSNPVQRYMVRCRDILAIHKLVAVVEGGTPLPAEERAGSIIDDLHGSME
jgi:hypothetical protein